MIKIICDTCRIDVTNLKKIEIGSENGKSLKFSNETKKDVAVISLSDYNDLHFCSKKCFIDYFFDSKF